MWSKRMLPVLSMTVAILLGVLWSVKLGPFAQVRMAKEAERVAQGPMKLDVKPLAKAYRVGDSVVLEVSLRDAYDRSVAAPSKTLVVVETISPSGKKKTETVYFQAGERVQRYQFSATEEGLIRISARHAENQLREGTYVVLVGRAVARPRPVRPRAVRPSAFLHGGNEGLGAERRPAAFRLVEVGWPPAPDAQEPNMGPPAELDPNAPRLLLQLSGGGHEFLADGLDAARILVFYMNPDGSPATRKIRVWMTWSNGELEPQPLEIKEGENFAEATLRSHWPVESHVALVSSSPAYQVEGPSQYTVKFGPPIYGIKVHGPEQLSLVDKGLVMVELFDPSDNAIQTSVARTVTFTPLRPTVWLRPLQVDIPPGGFSARAVVIPTSLGPTELSVSTPGYKSVVIKMEVTGLTVILLCVGGGIVGGICAFKAFQGSLPWRLFLGVVGGAVLAWLYVFVGLPRTESRIAHNLVSVLFMSLLGGYLGLQALDFVAKKLGFIGGEGKA
ncbi:MAG: hypothetical protein LAO21_12050 [Acidobacteriia bacterium]|nr:hypothetical protein [Terriglobia bacterium]